MPYRPYSHERRNQAAAISTVWPTSSREAPKTCRRGSKQGRELARRCQIPAYVVGDSSGKEVTH